MNTHCLRCGDQIWSYEGYVKKLEAENKVLRDEKEKLKNLLNVAVDKLETISHQHATVICADGSADGDETFDVAMSALEEIKEGLG